MNRIETRIIVMVADRLSAARDSEAKNELIEELSENLYQHYQDLTAEGMTEEEALRQAMESLGDTDELIAYLQSIDTEGYGPENTWEESGEGSDENTSYKRKPNFFGSDLEKGIGDMVNAAVSAAKTAANYAIDTARDMSEQFKEKYPDGFTWQFSSERSRTVDCTSIPSENVHSLDIRLINGDVQIYLVEDADAPIEVDGDTELIQTTLREDGVLSVKQGNTASSSALFKRGMIASDIEIRMPGRFWENISISTVNGDICAEDGLTCRTLVLQTQSGDMELQEASCGSIAFHSASGDITGTRLKGDVYAETKSGDVELDGLLGQCAASSTSGDVSFAGECAEINCSSTSGDVEVKLESLPKKAKIASLSGDCSVHVPGESGFRLSYHTVSGEFDTNLTLSGVYKGKKGELSYLDGGDSAIQVSSVSGDLGIYGN